MRRKFTNPFGFVHSSDMIGRYTHTRKQANLFFPLFSFFFLFYTNRTGLPHTRQAGSVLSVRFIMRRLQQATANPKTFRRIRTAPRRGRRLCRPDKYCGFAEDFRENAAFCGRTEASAPTRHRSSSIISRTQVWCPRGARRLLPQCGQVSPSLRPRRSPQKGQRQHSSQTAA